MAGLIVIAVIALYFIVLVGCSIAGYKIAAKRNLSTGKRWLGAAIGFGLIFLPVFWDVIPTLWLHRHYCETEGGFTVYKTLEQWKLENPGLAETLSEQLEPEYSSTRSQRHWITQRFYSENSQDAKFAHAIGREEEVLVDSITHQTLARSINFWRGHSWNLISSGGSLDEYRQLLVLSWGNRLCGEVGTSPNEKMRELKVNILNMGRTK